MTRQTDLEWIIELGVSPENIAIRIGRSPAVVVGEIEYAHHDDDTQAEL